MKKVLIPTNLGEASARVVKGAVAFLRECGGAYTCFLLNTYMVPPTPSGQIIRVNDELKKKSLEGLKAALQSAEASLGNGRNGRITFELISQIGSLTNVIPRLVEERGINWVIVGKNSDPKQEEVVSLLNRLHCPALVMP